MTTFSVHSMGDSLTQPDWPSLTQDEIDFIEHHYPTLGRVHHILWYSPRPFSTTCLAETTQHGQIVIKRHAHRLRTAEDIRDEHAFIQHLHDCQVPVSLPLLTMDNTTVISNASWTYELFSKAEGQDIYRQTMSWTPFLSSSHAYAAGQALAQCHIASASYTAPARQTHFLMASDQIARAAEPIHAIRDWIDAHPLTAQFLKEYPWQQATDKILTPLYRSLQPYQSFMVPQWSHNDWHASNLLWSDNASNSHVVTIIDFGLSNQTSAIYDIATAIERNMVAWLSADKQHRVDINSLQAFLDGYQQVSPINRDTLAAIAALLPVVHVEYALSEIDYFLGITHSPINADIAYQDYLLGHAVWFTGEEGQQLLHLIQTHSLTPYIAS